MGTEETDRVSPTLDEDVLARRFAEKEGDFGGLGFEEVGLRFEEEIDLRKLEEMLPKKPLESALLVFCLMIFGK